MDITPKENKDYYLSQEQRAVLLQLLTEPTLEQYFFLTGGTALSVFYLNHRTSNDIDLFSCTPQNLAELRFWIRHEWPHQSVIIKESPHFLSCLIRDTKVDIVIDPFSLEEVRPTVQFDNGHHLHIDTIHSIVANKLCACVSRTEPKDYIDLYIILKSYSEIQYQTIYTAAQQKDAIFDDPPTVAFQIEEGIAFIQDQPELLPELRTALNFSDFLEFYTNLTQWIYQKLDV
jgi:hypothetical protein